MKVMLLLHILLTINIVAEYNLTTRMDRIVDDKTVPQWDREGIGRFYYKMKRNSTTIYRLNPYLNDATGFIAKATSLPLRKP